MKHRSKVVIWESCNFLCSRNQSVVSFIDPIELQVFFVYLNAPISGGIVNDDNFVVTIVLHKDGIQIVLYPKTRIIIVARNNDAEREFFSNFGQ